MKKAPRRVSVRCVSWTHKRLWVACLLQLALGALVQPASDLSPQYIDPGSGALLVQLAVSFFVGLLFYLRSVRRFFAGLYARLVKRTPRPEAESTDQPSGS
jgi:hypothetical protein